MMSPADRLPLGKAGRTSTECQAKIDRVKESDVHKQVAGWLRIKGVFYVHSRTDKRTTNALGVPDFILAAWDGTTLPARAIPYAIEIKVNGNTLSTEQEKVRDLMQANGWLYFVCSSLQDVITVTGIK